MPDRSSKTLSILIPVLFFGSGLTALAYQVIWFKRLSHVWGSSSLATASVVGAFLLGLGVGARLEGGASRASGRVGVDTAPS